MREKWIKRALMLLGFGTAAACSSSCSSSDEEGIDVPVLYGSPQVYLTIEGRVVNGKGEPIPGIRITTDRLTEQGSAGRLSNSRGNFTLICGMWPATAETFSFSDIDGPENGGEFAPREIEVTYSAEDRDPDRTDSGGWSTYYKKNIGDVVLTEVGEAGEAE